MAGIVGIGTLFIICQVFSRILIQEFWNSDHFSQFY